jgi:hypothetical protein
MSYKWPDKDKDEIVDYSVDWSRFLGSDTISSALWFIKDADGVKTQVADADVVNGLQFVTGTQTLYVATARFSLGTNNTRYLITCQITTSSGLQYERSIFLRVKEK